MNDMRERLAKLIFDKIFGEDASMRDTADAVLAEIEKDRPPLPPQVEAMEEALEFCNYALKYWEVEGQTDSAIDDLLEAITKSNAALRAFREWKETGDG